MLRLAAHAASKAGERPAHTASATSQFTLRVVCRRSRQAMESTASLRETVPPRDRRSEPGVQVRLRWTKTPLDPPLARWAANPLNAALQRGEVGPALALGVRIAVAESRTVIIAVSLQVRRAPRKAGKSTAVNSGSIRDR